jgi:hypothetical protein
LWVTYNLRLVRNLSKLDSKDPFEICSNRTSKEVSEKDKYLEVGKKATLFGDVLSTKGTSSIGKPKYNRKVNVLGEPEIPGPDK